MANTYTNLLYHLIFSTKERHPLISPEIQEPLYLYIGGIVRQQKGVLLAVGGMPDHIHLLVNLRAEPSLALHLKAIKGSSSRRINRANPELRFAWQAGYGAFSVSQSQVRRVRRYIQEQPKHHRQTSYKEELTSLLERNRVKYDERYLLG
ncbi:MAG: IS200/IS605 family transposase [Acidobacteriota bacterium]